MSSPVLKIKQKIYLELIMSVAILMILVLTSLNISTFLTARKVLGTETSNPDTKSVSDETKFWEDFLVKNPNYIPGWIEIGRTDKAKEIDPNFNP